MLKVVGYIVLLFVGVFVFAFLIGSFINANFNLKAWSEDSRLGVGLLGAVVFLFGSIAVLINYIGDEELKELKKL